MSDPTVFVTGNANKLKEVKAILAAGDSGIEVTSQAVDGQSVHFPSVPRGADYIVPELQGTTQEVAIAKCRAAAEKVSLLFISSRLHAHLSQLGTACVTEDTALCFKALNGLPGPYIKDFMANLGHEGKS
jgi:inosine triphosphate pyrophosphatase